MLVVCLVEKHVFAITTLCGPVFQDALLRDAVLRAEPLPIHRTHFKSLMSESAQAVLSIDGTRTLVAALPQLHRDNFARHSRDSGFE